MLMRRDERYAKAKHMNMTGSIKDLMALHVLTQAYQSGRMQPGDRIAGATAAIPASRLPHWGRPWGTG